MNKIDLKIHEAAVRLFRSRFPNAFKETDDQTKKTHYAPYGNFFVRQKTELHPFRNVFIETLSVVHTQAIGGPWQAFADGNQFAIHYFPSVGKAVWYNLTPTTLDLLKSFCVGAGCMVQNNGYYTLGYPISIEELKNALGNMLYIMDVPGPTVTKQQLMQM